MNQDEQASLPQPAQASLPGTPAAGGVRAHAVPGMDTLTAGREAAAFVAALFNDVPADGPASVAAAPVGEMQNADDASGDLFASPAEDGVSDDEAPVMLKGEGQPALQGQHVLVLGLGASGLAMARWCVRQGARVSVADTRGAPPQLAALRKELPQVEFIAGDFSAALVESVERSDVRAVFKSPGLTPAQVAPVWQTAKARGLWTGGELDLFAHALASLRAEHGYRPKVLAITGTNGKTTTTSLTGLLVEQADKTVAVAGNIGPNLLDVLSEKLDANALQKGEPTGSSGLPEVWVLELSSFQLDEVRGFEPTAAVVLNLTQDHLDWHQDMAAYGAAKARVFGLSGLPVLNRDDAAVMAMIQPGALLTNAKGKAVKSGKARPRDYISFGTGMPQRPGDYGLEQVNGMTWLVRALEADETQKRKRGERSDKVEEEELHIQRLLPADALRIRGRHNATNALAALALAQAAGCPLGPLLFGLREYRGEPHRVEPVAIVREVEYFDDSKGTNVGATVAALTGLGGAMNTGDSNAGARDLVSDMDGGLGRRLVVILGGEGKGQDFSPLAEPARRHARAVILIGRDAPLIRAALQDNGVALFDATDMADAVRLASTQAHSGDAVLLSPACASFDMFDNYEHRARAFVEAVQALAHDAGGDL